MPRAVVSGERPQIVLKTAPRPHVEEKVSGSEQRFDSIDEARRAFKGHPERHVLRAEIWVNGKLQWTSMTDEAGKVWWREIRS
jgi:hypothetical protein